MNGIKRFVYIVLLPLDVLDPNHGKETIIDSFQHCFTYLAYPPSEENINFVDILYTLLGVSKVKVFVIKVHIRHIIVL